jgi:hypothetical protein
MESVFALKARIGEIDQKSVLIARRRLEADLKLAGLVTVLRSGSETLAEWPGSKGWP